MVIGSDGKPKTNSQQIPDLTTGGYSWRPSRIGEEMAGYKGYGYATVVEVLSRASGGQFCGSSPALMNKARRCPTIWVIGSLSSTLRLSWG